MKQFKKVIAALLVAVLSVCMLSTAAFAASEKDLSEERTVALAEKALKQVDMKDLNASTLENPVLIYFGSQPRVKADYAGTQQNLPVEVAAEIGVHFAKSYVEKTLVTLQTAANDTVEGLQTAPETLVQEFDEKAPAVSEVYRATGPAGEVALRAVLLPGYLATNAGTLAFVFVGGGAAFVIIFALTGILSPLIAVTEGPRVVAQLLRDLA